MGGDEKEETKEGPRICIVSEAIQGLQKRPKRSEIRSYTRHDLYLPDS